MSDSLITRDIANWMPKSFNEERRSVKVIAVTENPLLNRNLHGNSFYQIIVVSGVHLPVNGQVPLLDCHSRMSVSNVLGSARNFIINGDSLECDVFFSGTSMGIEAAQKVKEGHLTDFSVGFLIMKNYWIPEGETQMVNGRSFRGPVQVITQWELLELSIAPIGKDRHAKVRIWDGIASDQDEAPFRPNQVTRFQPDSEIESGNVVPISRVVQQIPPEQKPVAHPQENSASAEKPLTEQKPAESKEPQHTDTAAAEMTHSDESQAQKQPDPQSAAQAEPAKPAVTEEKSDRTEKAEPVAATPAAQPTNTMNTESAEQQANHPTHEMAEVAPSSETASDDHDTDRKYILYIVIIMLFLGLIQFIIE